MSEEQKPLDLDVLRRRAEHCRASEAVFGSYYRIDVTRLVDELQAARERIVKIEDLYRRTYDQALKFKNEADLLEGRMDVQKEEFEERIAELERERDETHASWVKSIDIQSELVDKLAASELLLAQVREMLVDAPHDEASDGHGDPLCRLLKDIGTKGSGPCNCWKSYVFALLDGTR
jgi:hypothetical protein